MFLQLETATVPRPQTTMVLTYQDLQGIIAIYLRWPSRSRYLDLLHHAAADESQKIRNGCPRSEPCFIVLVVLVSCKVTFSHSTYRPCYIIVILLQYKHTKHLEPDL